MDDFRQILGVRFYTGDLEGVLDLSLGAAGLIVVPSAPVLSRMAVEPSHAEAVEGSDFAITDSGLMVLLWLLFQGERLHRISGLRYLQGLLKCPELRAPGATFWVMPSAEDAQGNCAWLQSQGLDAGDHNCYVAPMYARTGRLEDATLLGRLKARRPRFVIICLGGGVQERLGYYLRGALSYRPSIVCTGAAIGFFSGRQARIPKWADRLMLGWLVRTLHSPREFLPRYRSALALIPLLWKYGQHGLGGDR
jgi:UDP-N-acetyl-D-mannosaminuronic acid transferase (WecB/TagA/CpsF family)